MKLKVLSDDFKEKWDTCINHPIQSWAWGNFRQTMNGKILRLGVFVNNKLESCLLITIHSIPKTSWKIGYLPKGSLPTKDFLNELHDFCKKHNIIYIQLEPNVRASHNNNLLKLPNIQKAHHPLFTKYTFEYDLTKSEDTLLAMMHHKSRYNIKVAKKHNVIVKEDNSQNAFESYIRLSKETTHRQAFYAHDETYHRNMWDVMHKAGIAKLWLAKYDNNILAAWIIFLWDKTIYYPYGASSRNHRNVMAPNLLLWEIARWGKKNKYTSFDLWGALGPEPDPNDPWYGFHRFKAGYRPQMIEFVGSYDFVVNPLLYRLFVIGNKTRWAFLNSKKKIPLFNS
ncbi:lipid II:glycine glycyltransferase FemX [Patescibacteria group bacterium]